MLSLRRRLAQQWLQPSRLCLAGVAVLGLAFVAPARAAADSVFLEELTSTELRQRIAAGAGTVLVPIGGTEQNGAHMVLGKHNVRVRVLAARIAVRLGDTLVAPVLAYVPEGAIEPPTQHMRHAGTISIPDAAFETVLEAAARSLRRHGFRTIVLLGDHGGTHKSQARVAARLNREWAAAPASKVLALGEYYRAAQADYAAMLKSRGYAAEEIGLHAGLADTALALAVDPALVRTELLRTGAQHEGVSGDPQRATAELGRLCMEHIVDVSVATIRAHRIRRTAADPVSTTQ
jgi:creatinine amidohydrolase/Fe(II)-dependent formamide hydrolase-like protein